RPAARVRRRRAPRRVRHGHRGRRRTRRTARRPLPGPRADPARPARGTGPPPRLRPPRPLDLPRTVPAGGDAPRHAGGRPRHHRGHRGGPARRRSGVQPERRPDRRRTGVRRRPAVRPQRGGGRPRGGPRPLRAPPLPGRLGAAAEGGGPMRIAMGSERASPLAAVGGVDAGGQNVYVARLSEELARRGHHVTVYTRRDAVALPERVPLPGGAVVEHVPAGPPQSVPKDELLPHMAAFGAHLARAWGRDRPDVVRSHFWMSGMAS